jgi:hypothetical protein
LADQLYRELREATFEPQDGALTQEAMARLRDLAAEAQAEVSGQIPQEFNPYLLRPEDG